MSHFKYYYLKESNDDTDLIDQISLSLSLSSVILHNIAERSNSAGIAKYNHFIKHHIINACKMVSIPLAIIKIQTIKSFLTKDVNNQIFNQDAVNLELIHPKDLLNCLFIIINQMINKCRGLIRPNLINAFDNYIMQNMGDNFRSFKLDIESEIDYSYKPTVVPVRTNIDAIRYLIGEE